ncbi:MAG: hypothetical protein QUV05_19805, partial [Phycisphaerae bacterium]|nr:hypothetical protein [Phycisphaerae bacterium]
FNDPATTEIYTVRNWSAASDVYKRQPYGYEITPGKLAVVASAEALLRSLGLAELRVRHHGDTARIEVALPELSRLVEPETRKRVVDGLKALGYRYITIDLEGFRSGSLNPVQVDRPGS